MARLAWPLLIVVSLITAGCAGSSTVESTLDLEENTGSTAVETGDDGPTADSDTAEIPDELPVGLPDGGAFRGVFPPAEGTMNDQWTLRMLYPAEEFDSIVAFYDAWFAEQGIDVEAYPTETSGRWRWIADIGGSSRTQQVHLSTGGTYDEGGTTLDISYDVAEG